MRILALELSTGQGSVAWAEDHGRNSVRVFANDRKHSGEFFEHLRHCLSEFGLPDAIVVGLGPGSYAGVRIAIATAIGLRAASAAKLTGIASICAIESDASDYWVVGDARRQSFFLGRVSGGKLVEGPSLHSRPELRTRLLDVTEPVYFSEPLTEFPTARLAYPSARRLAEVARGEINEMPDSQSLEPIYLRGPHITVPRAPLKAATK